jgi:hypothetical protein
VDSGGVMWTVMGDVVVQETFKITKWSGVLGSFDNRRRGMLLGRGTVHRWSCNGSVWGNNWVGQVLDGPAADGKAELGSHGGVLCCGGAWLSLSRTTSEFHERGFRRGTF